MNILDRIVSFVSPEAGLRRLRARQAVRVYDAAQPGRRTSAFYARQQSANAEIQSSMKALRDRSREMTRNTPYFPRVIQIIVAHSVGLGMRPVPRTGSDRIDVKVADLWEEWQKEADVEGRLTHYAQQALAMRGVIESGEIVARFIDMKRGTSKVPLKIQMLESDFIDQDRDGFLMADMPEGTEYSRLGVGLGEYDRRTGLWLHPYHPGEMRMPLKLTDLRSKFVRREDLLHMFRADRPGQVRGVTWFAPVLLSSRDLKDFLELGPRQGARRSLFCRLHRQQRFNGPDHRAG